MISLTLTCLIVLQKRSFYMGTFFY